MSTLGIKPGPQWWAVRALFPAPNGQLKFIRNEVPGTINVIGFRTDHKVVETNYSNAD